MNEQSILSANMQLANESAATTCTVTVTNLMYAMQGKHAHIDEIDTAQSIGEWIGKVHAACPDLRAFFIRSDDGPKFIGYDYNLACSFSDYPIFQGNVTVHAQHMLDPWSAQHNIAYPLVYFGEQKAWPPCSNWRDGDPLNCAPFLIWNGYGQGPIEVDRTMDNSYRNLVLLTYPNGVAKAVNRYMYLRSIVSTNPRDPLTNKETRDVKYIIEALIYNRNDDSATLPVVNVVFA